MIVAERDGAVVAWGSLNIFNARPAYRFVADFSIYVERAWRGKGLGRVVLARLIELAREHGFHKMVLSAFPSNPGGMALYTKLGFDWREYCRRLWQGKRSGSSQVFKNCQRLFIRNTTLAKTSI